MDRNIGSGGGTLHTLYCDFMKAFDKVPHQRLVYKIEKYGITGNVLGWIKSFLSNRLQYVSIENKKSNCAPVTSGIPQGSVLGPILFVLYINDLPEVVSDGSFVFLFADDTKVFRKINSYLDRQILQKDIDSLVNWSNDWLLKFHPDKCVAMELGKQYNSEKPIYKMGTHTLNQTTCEKDLGVHIDDKLNFDSHINEIVNKANRIMAIARKTFDYMDTEIFNYIFKGMVRPHLEYAAPVWSPFLVKHKEQLENVQRRATKIVPGLSTLSYPERLRKLSLPTLSYRRTRGDLIQVYKLTCEEGGYDKSLPNLLTASQTNLRGHNKKLFIGHCRKDIKKYSFPQRVSKIWNSLPEHIVNAEDLIKFEKLLDEHWQGQPLKYDDFKAEII